MSKRPQRKRKGDRILHGMADRADVECDYATGPLDRLALEMDRKWGIDRLPELVSAETATKYGSAIAKLNDALARKDPQDASARAAVCMRGLQAMDREAESLGQKPATGDFWEYEVSGFRFGVLKDGREWQIAQDARPDLTFFTLREVGLALKAYCETVPIAEAKKTFPGAQIVKLPNLGPQPEDEVPF